MCGITFIHDAKLDHDLGAARCHAAIHGMRHRGPDGINTVSGEGWHMGHARLAIIGLGDGNQPMQDPLGRWKLTYNGEIYNYVELRGELSATWNFRTHSDTEVLLAGLILHGADFLSRLNGMWAFALWDDKEHSLLVGRDRLGKKPVYVRHGTHHFACASELPALRTLTGNVVADVDLDSLADILKYGCPLPGRTIYRDVTEVLPGHTMVWKPGKPAIQKPFWSLDQAAVGAPNLADAGRQVFELLSSAVKFRLVADVEVGAFLSGGVDSSLVSALAARHSSRQLQTFSIGFADASFDETDYALRIAQYLGTRHTSRQFEPGNRSEMARLILEHVGMPFADASLLPTAMVSALASEHVKVVISGDGADELFGGYQRYLGRVILRWYSRLPRPLQSSAEMLIRALPEPLHHHSRSILKKAHLFARSAAMAREDLAAYVAPRLFSDAEIARLAPELVGRGHAPPSLPERVNGDDVMSMMCRDALIYLPQDILVKSDRASMAHSVEQRCPFLDYRLVELALSLGSDWHFRGLRGKALLRESAAELTPPWLWKRRKQGFSVPVGAWFKGALGDDLIKTLDRPGKLPVRVTEVRRLLAEHRSGKSDHGQRLWLLWTYALWEANIRDGQSATAFAQPAREKHA